MADREILSVWNGVVEDRKDPLKMGRVRVRIVGWHTSDVSQLPTSLLPWAEVNFSVGLSNFFSGPKEGDWVAGYFRDGQAAQHPVVTGIAPAIRALAVRRPTASNGLLKLLSERATSEQGRLNVLQQEFARTKDIKRIATLAFELNKQQIVADNTTRAYATLERANSFRLQVGFRDNRSQAEVNRGPRLPIWMKDGQAGEPSIPRIARGIIVGTSIEYTNARRDHVCDIALYVRRAMAIARLKVGQIMSAIREAIAKLLDGFSTSPAIAAIAGKIRRITYYIKQITAILAEINDAIAVLVYYIRVIKAIIEFILELPDYIKRLLDRCVQEAIAELKAGFFEIVKEIFSGVGGAEFDLIGDITDLITATNDLFTEAQILAQAPELIRGAIENPSGLTFAEKERLVSELVPGYNEFKEQILGPIL
jgi:hypothetical protein